MLELTVATALRHQDPTLLLQETEDLGDFHGGSIQGRSARCSLRPALRPRTVWRSVGSIYARGTGQTTRNRSHATAMPPLNVRPARSHSRVK